MTLVPGSGTNAFEDVLLIRSLPSPPPHCSSLLHLQDIFLVQVQLGVLVKNTWTSPGALDMKIPPGSPYLLPGTRASPVSPRQCRPVSLLTPSPLPHLKDLTPSRSSSSIWGSLDARRKGAGTPTPEFISSQLHLGPGGAGRVGWEMAGSQFTGGDA